jgi:hypothetical protein
MTDAEIIETIQKLRRDTSHIEHADERKYQIVRRLRMILPKEGPTLLEAVNCWKAHLQSEARDA